MKVTKIELRDKGVIITPSTPQNVIEKYLKDYPELKAFTDGKETGKPKAPKG